MGDLEWTLCRYQETPGEWVEVWILYDTWWDPVVKCYINKKISEKDKKIIKCQTQSK